MLSLGKPTLEGVRRRFIRQFGEMGPLSDVAPSVGQVMGLMVFEGRDYSFSELATQLDLSRGSVSQAVRILEREEIITRYSKPGDRQDYFHLKDAPFETFVMRVVEGWQKARLDVEETIQSALATGEELPPGFEARLQGLIAFYLNCERFFLGALEMHKNTVNWPQGAQNNDERTLHGDTN